MRGIVILIILLAVGAGVGSALLTREATKDPTHWLPIAFAVPIDDTIQFQVGVGPRIPMMDPPQTTPQGIALWDEWVTSHFQLKDAVGQPLRLAKMGTSAAFMEKAAAGAPDFVLWAEVKKGASYAMDYVPVLAEKKRFRYAFTAPAEEATVRRCAMEPAQ